MYYLIIAGLVILVYPVRERPAEGTASAAPGRLFSNGVNSLCLFVDNPRQTYYTLTAYFHFDAALFFSFFCSYF